MASRRRPVRRWSIVGLVGLCALLVVPPSVGAAGGARAHVSARGPEPSTSGVPSSTSPSGALPAAPPPHAAPPRAPALAGFASLRGAAPSVRPAAPTVLSPPRVVPSVAPATPAPTYTVTFTEHGLPTGTHWYLNVTGTPYLNGSGASLSASLANGSYGYGVGSDDHAFYAPGGTFAVDGAATSVPVAFRPADRYTVTFNETGLPHGKLWFVNVSGSPTLSSTGGNITTSLYNGSYTFNIALLGDHWIPSAHVGFFYVAGANFTPASPVFVYGYAVTFDAPGGTPGGTGWSVALTGSNAVLLTVGPSTTTTVRGTTNASLTFYEPNGSYTYFAIVSADSGYRGSGSFAIDGQPVTITPPGLPPGSLSPYLLYGAVAGAVLFAVAMGLLVFGRRRPRGPQPEAPPSTPRSAVGGSDVPSGPSRPAEPGPTSPPPGGEAR